MKVIIDTNTVVSAIVRDRVPEEVIFYIVTHPGITWIVSDDILAEYKEVLQRKKFDLPLEIRQRWFSMFDRLTTKIDVDIEVDFPRDRKDAIFLACSLASDADFLITGDHDFGDAMKLGNTKIISLSLFKKLVMGRALCPPSLPFPRAQREAD